MTHIGIVGAGVAGLQLGLHLQMHGIESTLYAEQLRAQPLRKIVCRNVHTGRARIRAAR
jgi:2-polyprenyl-6-methoxyphenol hydroxylase-like FAD-dependent oxidoreductase